MSSDYTYTRKVFTDNDSLGATLFFTLCMVSKMSICAYGFVMTGLGPIIVKSSCVWNHLSAAPLRILESYAFQSKDYMVSLELCIVVGR